MNDEKIKLTTEFTEDQSILISYIVWDKDRNMNLPY